MQIIQGTFKRMWDCNNRMNVKMNCCEYINEIALAQDKFQLKDFVKTILNRRV
jgi:hypothetical protein